MKTLHRSIGSARCARILRPVPGPISGPIPGPIVAPAVVSPAFVPTFAPAFTSTFAPAFAPVLSLLFAAIVFAALAACSTSARAPAAPAIAGVAASTPLPASAPSPAATRTLDAYKADVARHVMLRNPERVFEGELPPMLPAVVVLNITIDRAGQLTDVQVQRSRDPGASEVALASLRRSGPLPPPDGLGPQHADLMTFSETFLFGDRYRFQLRTLAGPQRAGL